MRLDSEDSMLLLYINKYELYVSSLTQVLVMNFFNLTLKAKATKAKISKWDCIELKSFCTTKEMSTK